LPSVGGSIPIPFATGRNAMHGTVVLLMTLSGLGSHNKGCNVFQAPPTPIVSSGQCVANLSTYPAVAPAYPIGPASTPGGCDTSGYSGGGLRSTLFSFVLGRDPDVPTARDIEASVYAGYHGR
jgi:hypothetical protein